MENVYHLKDFKSCQNCSCDAAYTIYTNPNTVSSLYLAWVARPGRSEARHPGPGSGLPFQSQARPESPKKPEMAKNGYF